MSKAGNEHALRRAVSAWLGQQKGVWYLKVTPNRFTRAGVPDYLVCVGGRFLAIELKRDGTEPDARQELEARRIVAAGGLYVVCRSLAEVVIAVELVS